MRARIFILTALLLSAGNLWADQPVVLGEESIGQVLISPSGSHLVMVREAAKGDAVFIVNKARKKVEGRFLLPEQTFVHRIGWVGSESLVVEVTTSSGTAFQPQAEAGRLSLLTLPDEEGALAVS